MSRPRHKCKSKASTSEKPRGGTKEICSDVQATFMPADTYQLQCLTLEEDEITQCGQLATEGHPKPERCKVHHGQYRVLCKKYKDASKVVDDVQGGAELPTKEQISRYTDWHAALEKSRWVHTYLEAIRIERAGRVIHQKRFFLKVDDGHKRRLKLLEKEMARVVDVLEALQRSAFELYRHNGTLHTVNNQAPSTAEVDLEKQSKRTTEEVLESIYDPDAFRDSTRKKAPRLLPTPEVGDEDLIDMSLRAGKEQMLMILKPLIDFESFIEVFGEGDPQSKTGPGAVLLEIHFFIYQQVSFRDLILSDDFSMEDLARLFNLFLNPLAFPLKWFKDAVLDALAISRHGTAANVDDAEGRFPLLGGWVFNRSHTVSMSDEAWWLLLEMLEPPANVENRFVRLCNSFDDLVGFLSFEAFGLVPSPSFCESPPHFDTNDPALSRNHLSLSGIIVADMVASPSPPKARGPIPTTRRATKQGCVVWAEIETRAYMFGAVRNEKDGFVEAFLGELRARPDLFQVVLRSETAPGREVEMFGSGPSNNEALPAMRARNFEAPPSPTSPFAPTSTNGKWEVCWSAVDVLYGERKEMQGYFTMLERDIKFFRFKTFPVTYFVILDTVPYRDQSVLARNVSWAALRARGYAEGEYRVRKYAVAADKLLEQCAQERLGWIPEEMRWKLPKMQPQMRMSSCRIM